MSGFKFVTAKVAPKWKANADKKVEYEIRAKQFDETAEGYAAVLADVGGENGVVKMANDVYLTGAKAKGTAPVRTAKADANIAERIESGIKAAFEFVFEDRGISKAAQQKMIDEAKEKAKTNPAEADKIKAELLAALGF